MYCLLILITNVVEEDNFLFFMIHISFQVKGTCQLSILFLHNIILTALLSPNSS